MKDLRRPGADHMLTISDTVTEMVQWVFPEHAGAPGQIHGGRMMQWIATVGTMAAARVARGQVVLGAMDDIDFLHPVKVGEIAVLRAQVEAIGRCSIEVGVKIFAENVQSGRRALTLNSHLVFVKVNEDLKPVPVPATLEPRGPAEEALFVEAQERRRERLERLTRRRAAVLDTADEPEDKPRWALESSRAVLPEDTLFGHTMFPGKLLMDIDEAGGILSMRYCRGLVMTACLDAMDFFAPINTHEVVTFKAALNHVGNSSLEIGVKVLTEVPWSGEVRHACTAYLTFVHLGPDLRPQPCPPFTPQTLPEKRRWDEAEARRARRLERVKRLKASIQEGR
ncbi:MAG TPA: hotdog domain-containing protein [Verrucomicrobiae bacterium]|nr:hotdog domain-containing protein [Verrucomicrobiae bacterium]